MTDRKKAWVAPELIVIVRGKPEEAVLTACKVTGVFSSFDVTQDDCINSSCTAVCSIRVGS